MIDVRTMDAIQHEATKSVSETAHPLNTQQREVCERKRSAFDQPPLKHEIDPLR